MPRKRTGYSRRSILKKGAIATSALVIGGTAASGTAVAGIGDGRVVHCHLNNLNYDRDRGEIVAGHVHDASPEQNHGEWHDTEVDPVVKDGAVGNAFEFTGEDYIEIEDDESLNPSDVTVATWLKFTEDSEYHFFLSKRDSENNEYQMYYRGAESGPGQTLAYWDGSTVYDSGLSLSKNTWHHLAWVVSEEDGFKGYHDGEHQFTIAADTPTSGTAPLFIGKDTVGNYASGITDEVRVYDRALSEEEIGELADMDED